MDSVTIRGNRSYPSLLCDIYGRPPSAMRRSDAARPRHAVRRAIGRCAHGRSGGVRDGSWPTSSRRCSPICPRHGLPPSAGLGFGLRSGPAWRPLAVHAATVELTRRAGENAGAIKDIYGGLGASGRDPASPVYALMVPILRLALAQWRIRRFALHRRVVHHRRGRAVLRMRPRSPSTRSTGSPLPLGHARNHPRPLWILAVATRGMLQWVCNTGMLLPPSKASDPGRPLRDIVLAREDVQNDVAEVCVAVLVTFAICYQPADHRIRPAFRHAAAAVLPTCPAGERLPHRFEDWFAQRGYLGAGGGGGGRAGGADPHPAGPRAGGH